MYVLLSAFFCTLIAAALIIHYESLHQHFSGDYELSGPQKFHKFSVPRIGGLAIFISLIPAAAIRISQDLSSGYFFATLVLCSLPAFLAGLAEDLSKRTGILARLLGTAISAYLVGYLLDGWVSSLDIFGVDYLLTIPYVSVVFTIIALSGLANAYNIIDGFNGLASMVGVITLLAIAYVGFRVGDITVLISALAMIGAIAGFFLWNYPRGLIFLGDGGAYLIGFWIGALSVLLVARNSSVSPWFALLVNAYPIFETLFSMWRRKVHQGKNPSMPDGAHFHTLIYRRIRRWAQPHHMRSSSEAPSHSANAKTSPYLWLLSSIAIFPAVIFRQDTWALQILSMLFCASYVWMYRCIVKFKTPFWLKN